MRNHIFILFLIQAVLGVIVEQTIPMSTFRKDHGWMRLSSMHLEDGEAELRGAISFHSDKKEDQDYHLQLVVMTLQEFEKDKEQHCTIKTASKQHTQSIDFYLTSSNGFEQKQKFRDFLLVDSEKMIVVLRDCQSTLINQYFQSKAYLQLHFSLAHEHSHFTAEHYFDLLLIPLQAILILRLIREAFLNKIDDIHSSDLNEYIREILILHSFALLSLGIDLFSRLIFGTNIALFIYGSLTINSVVQTLLIMILLNLSFGWRVTKITEPFASQGLLKALICSFWIFLNILQRVVDNNSWSINDYIYGLKIVVFLMILYGSYRQRMSFPPFSTLFYKRLAFIATFYIFSDYVESIAIASLTLQFKQDMQFTLFALRNSICLWLASTLLTRKNNIYQKIAMTKKSFMD